MEYGISFFFVEIIISLDHVKDMRRSLTRMAFLSCSASDLSWSSSFIVAMCVLGFARQEKRSFQGDQSSMSTPISHLFFSLLPPTATTMTKTAARGWGGGGGKQSRTMALAGGLAATTGGAITSSVSSSFTALRSVERVAECPGGMGYWEGVTLQRSVVFGQGKRHFLLGCDSGDWAGVEECSCFCSWRSGSALFMVDWVGGRERLGGAGPANGRRARPHERSSLGRLCSSSPPRRRRLRRGRPLLRGRGGFFLRQIKLRTTGSSSTIGK